MVGEFHVKSLSLQELHQDQGGADWALETVLGLSGEICWIDFPAGK